jgi:hypothetical protein
MTLDENVVSPGSAFAEAALVPQTINKLNSGLPNLVMNGNANAGPGPVTSTFQWNLDIAPGGTALISEDDNISSAPTLTPEPSVYALLTLSIAGASAFRKFRKNTAA